jgi:hypothetical protein
LDIADLFWCAAPRQHQTFSGIVDANRLSLTERAIAAVRRTPYRDYRDWHSIRDWAAGVAGGLLTPTKLAQQEEQPRLSMGPRHFYWNRLGPQRAQLFRPIPRKLALVRDCMIPPLKPSDGPSRLLNPTFQLPGDLLWISVRQSTISASARWNGLRRCHSRAFDVVLTATVLH